MKKPFKKPSKAVSERMKRVKSKGTSLEKAMEEILTEMGVDFAFQPKLFGKPDFRIRDTNILLFCDSSFWHGRRKKEVMGEAFSKNKEFWTEKLERNKKRDQITNRKLRKEGWSVQRFWDTDILKNKEKVIRRIKKLMNHEKR